MRNGEARRAVALQEAQKTYGMQYAMAVALREDFPVIKTDVEDEILRIAVRYDNYLFDGRTTLDQEAKPVPEDHVPRVERTIDDA